MTEFTELSRLVEFISKEFPAAFSRTPGNEPIVDTAIILLQELKQVIDMNGQRPQGGW